MFRDLFYYLEHRRDDLRAALGTHASCKFGDYVRALLHEVIACCVSLERYAFRQSGPPLEGLFAGDSEHPAGCFEVLQRNPARPVQVGFCYIEESLD